MADETLWMLNDIARKRIAAGRKTSFLKGMIENAIEKTTVRTPALDALLMTWAEMRGVKCNGR